MRAPQACKHRKYRKDTLATHSQRESRSVAYHSLSNMQSSIPQRLALRQRELYLIFCGLRRHCLSSSNASRDSTPIPGHMYTHTPHFLNRRTRLQNEKKLGYTVIAASRTPGHFFFFTSPIQIYNLPSQARQEHRLPYSAV
jgi:hypothetical protein